MPMNILRRLPRLPVIVLSLFFFFLAAYSKKFVYLQVPVGPVPIFISDIVLSLLLAVGFSKIKFQLIGPNRLFGILLFLFLAYGILRLSFSVLSGVVQQFGFMDVVKQTAIFYQAVWVLVPLIFHKDELRKLFKVSLAGIAFAQLVGWVGFIFMGVYTADVSRLIGFPVGNETVLPLYLFSLVLFSPLNSFIYGSTFGLLWLTQFVLYMKRTWVFSVIVFTLPIVIWCISRNQKKKALFVVGTFLFGLFAAFQTLEYVKNRDRPIFYHISEKKLAEEERQNLSKFVLPFLYFLDGIYQNTDTFDPNVSVSQIIFKGDLAPGGSVLKPASLMAFRMHFWKQAWDGFKQSPVFGLGFGPPYAQTQLNGLPAMFEGKWVSGPHNGYLAILNRMGILGLILFSTLVMFPLFSWWKSGMKDELSLVMIGSFISVNFFVLFNVCLENPQGGIWYWFFLGTILKLSESKKEELQIQ